MPMHGQRSGQVSRNARAFVRVFAGVMITALVTSGLGGCRVTSRQPRREPPVIIVYNNSTVGLRVVSLRAAPGTGSEPDRIGSVSPVPRGTSQVFGRATDAPPLPPVGEISWSDDLGRDYSRKVTLEAALQEATGEPGEALVFEIRPGGKLVVYCRKR